MAFTASTKCQCLPSDFVQPGKGCKGPDACGGPGSAGVGDYCEKCTDNKCRRQAMEAVQKTKDARRPRQQRSSRKCKCAHDNKIGCKSPAQCAVFDCGTQGFCQSCESRACRPLYINNSKYFKQLSNETGLFIATQRTVVRPPATQPNPPVPPLAQSYAEQSSELYHNPGSHSYPPIAPSQSRAEQSSEPYGNPGSHSYPPIAPAHTGSYAEPSGEPYRDPANHSYPSPATVTTPAEANYLQAANTSSPSLASSSPAAELLTHPPCACQLGWPCNAGGLCEETIFLEGDWCGMCTLLDCNQ